MTLNDWLAHLEALHPATIELGLERVQRVADRLTLDFSSTTVVTVAGTNGKGSTVALLSSVLRMAGYRVGTYTSPHILAYNERVCVNGQPATDQELCASFAAVEAVREGTTLTYFEFGTVAALQHFAGADLDYLILEVGLGGRLDAVNIIDPDLAILTNVALDHMDWLGDTREAIGREKAGIFRGGVPALYGEREMPASVRETADRLGTPLLALGTAFDWALEDKQAGSWQWQGLDASGQALSLQHLPATLFNLDNVATVLQALGLMEPDLSPSIIVAGLRAAVLPGRLQRFPADAAQGWPETVVDVAHNPHAMANLVINLGRHFSGRSLRIVIAMLADKDREGVVSLLAPVPAAWYVGQIEGARGSSASLLYDLAQGAGVQSASRFESVAEAYEAACQGCDDNTLVIVTGSFFTVAEVMALRASTTA